MFPNNPENAVNKAFIHVSPVGHQCMFWTRMEPVPELLCTRGVGSFMVGLLRLFPLCFLPLLYAWLHLSPDGELIFSLMTYLAFLY